MEMELVFPGTVLLYKDITYKRGGQVQFLDFFESAFDEKKSLHCLGYSFWKSFEIIPKKPIIDSLSRTPFKKIMPQNLFSNNKNRVWDQN